MRGYTLVEIIIVLTVLGIIVMISYPTIMTTLKQAEERQYENFVETIIFASEAYIESNEEVYNLENPTDTVTIMVADLVDGGFYNANTQNPKTGETVDLNDEIIITVQANYVKNFDYVPNDWGGEEWKQLEI